MRTKRESERPVLVVDLGGTKIASAVIDAGSVVLTRDYRLTRADEGVEAVTGLMFEAVEGLLKESGPGPSQPDAISIAAAGAIDSVDGIVTVSPNLPGWRNVPLRDRLAERFGLDTFLVNDASAAALAEHRLGAGSGADNLIYITVSTGIGGGIVIDGQLYLGSSGAAGEIGHMAIDSGGPECYCGLSGCLEVLASGTAIAREAKKRLHDGQRSALTGLVAGDIDAVTAREVSQAALDGDHLAVEVVAQAARYLGIGMAGVVNIFNPDIIVFGGGVSKMGDFLLDPVRQLVKEKAFAISAQAVRIVTAELGDDVGLFGAAIFAREQKQPDEN
jgi:glucokinase